MWIETSVVVTTVSHVLDEYEEFAKRTRIRSLSRTRSVMGHLRRLLGHLDVRDLSEKALLDYTEQRKNEGVEYSTIHRELGGVLGPALSNAVSKKIIESKPQIPLPPRSEGRRSSLEPEQILRLLEVIEVGTPLHLFVMLAVFTGARMGAIMGLTWDRISFYLSQVDYRESDPDKRMKERAITPMCATLRQVLLREHGCTRTNRLFDVSMRTMQRYFAEAVQKAGLPSWVTPHILRHTAVTLIVMGSLKDGANGIPLAQAIVGHARMETTEKTYLHLVAAQYAIGVERLDREVGYRLPAEGLPAERLPAAA